MTDQPRYDRSDGRRWQLDTEREREGARIGIGEAALRETIEHLRKRGDTHCGYLIDGGSGYVDVNLTDPKWIPVSTSEATQ